MSQESSVPTEGVRTMATAVIEESPSIREALRHILSDFRVAAEVLSDDEARYLVDTYYQVQKYRKSSSNQLKALTTSGEPNEFLVWTKDLLEFIETQIKLALDRYTNQHPIGVWSKSITGIGPVIAAGLMAHINLDRTPSATALNRFAGMDPTSRWLGQAGAKQILDDVLGNPEYDDGYYDLESVDEVEAPTGRNAVALLDIVRIANATKRDPVKLIDAARTDSGTVTRSSLQQILARRPWNADLKRLCFLIGDSFTKQQNRDNDHYGKYVVARKLYEWRKNIDGEYSDQARAQASRFGKDTEAYAWYTGRYRLYPDDVVQAITGINELKAILNDPSRDTQYPIEEKMRQLTDGGELLETEPVEVIQEGVPMLPPAHIQMRCQRFATKLFLNHWFSVAFYLRYGQLAPQPYAIAHLDHTDEVPPPNMHLIVGMEDALRHEGRV